MWAWKFTGSTQWGSLLLACSSFIPSLLSFVAVLRTTIGSGHSMPSTCPNGTRLVEHWESCSSMVFLGKSMSHSRGVNSTRAEWVVRSILASSLWHKAVGALWGWPQGRVCYSGQSSNYHSHLLSHMRVHHLQLGALSCIQLCFTNLSPSFLSLKCISFCQNHISWHQLDCACKFIIISLLSVCFIVGLVLGFSMCFLEACLHLFNIGRDLPAACIHTYCGEEKSTGSLGHLPNMR